MAQSVSNVYVHGVFSTKGRQPLMAESSLREEMFGYLGGVSSQLGCQPVAVGGYSDHAHVLVRFSRTITISDWIKELKRVSTAFGKTRIPGFGWQAGYAAFSVDERGLGDAVAYIRNQETHHGRVSFQEELRAIMTENGIEWDERYFWE